VGVGVLLLAMENESVVEIVLAADAANQIAGGVTVADAARERFGRERADRIPIPVLLAIPTVGAPFDRFESRLMVFEPLSLTTARAGLIDGDPATSSDAARA
jgi:hypothetical protein